jgi:hypothetical protein
MFSIRKSFLSQIFFAFVSLNKGLNLYILMKIAMNIFFKKIAQMHFHSTKPLTLGIQNTK